MVKCKKVSETNGIGLLEIRKRLHPSLNMPTNTQPWRNQQAFHKPQEALKRTLQVNFR